MLEMCTSSLQETRKAQFYSLLTFLPFTNNLGINVFQHLGVRHFSGFVS